MDAIDFNLRYATLYMDENGNKVLFNPLHRGLEGSMITTFLDGFQIGGIYTLRLARPTLFITIGETEYSFVPTEKGFDLLIGEIVKNSFTRI